MRKEVRCSCGREFDGVECICGAFPRGDQHPTEERATRRQPLAFGHDPLDALGHRKPDAQVIDVDAFVCDSYIVDHWRQYLYADSGRELANLMDDQGCFSVGDEAAAVLDSGHRTGDGNNGIRSDAHAGMNEDLEEVAAFNLVQRP